MKLTVLAVGGVRGPLAAAVEEYEDRIRHYWKFQVVEVDAGAGRGSADPGEVMEAEGARLLQRLPAAGTVVALTREGKSLGSRQLSDWLQEEAVRGSRGVSFLIGGAFGLAPEVVARSSRRLSLSTMTLPHEMARLVLTEQIYRAGTIQRNEPYHKGVR